MKVPCPPAFCVWLFSIFCFQCSCSHAGEPSRYLKLPECIASIVVLPNIKEKINLNADTDLLVGVGFPIEMAITVPRPPQLQPIMPQAFLPPFSHPPQALGGRNPAGIAGPLETKGASEEMKRRMGRSIAEANLAPNILQRIQLYKSISVSMSRVGIPGDSCIQRAICEAAMTRQAQDEILFGELVSIVLRVPSNDLPEMAAYNEARRMGETNRDCSKYFDCPVSIFRTALTFG